MATTYEPIATNTLGADTATVTFSSIPQTYTDLVIVQQGRCSHADTNINTYYQFNGDTGSNYSVTRLQGNGSTAVSNRGSSQTVGYITYVPANNATAGEFSANIINIMNYSNATTYKTSISRSAVAGSIVASFVGLWRNTAAITSIVLGCDAGNWKSGSTFTLYGILKA
jgi:hypothetical protein